MLSLKACLFITQLAVSFTGTLADPSASTQQACKDIASVAPDRVHYPLDLTYIKEVQSYWSIVLREIKPACLVLPTSAVEVANAVQVLNKYPDVKFAVKSGGHDPSPGHATVQDGVLISTTEMKGATYDHGTNLAYVKPGGEWNDVIGDLEPHNVTVVGGRLGLVGVGGYLLQGGISFLSAQYGLAADSIVGWETVLPNGTIVNVDAAKQPDLAVAMRGSGSQFGIVTQFTIQAHPIRKVWGGTRIYSGDQADKIFAALHNFVPGGEADPKAAVILSHIVAVGSTPLFLIFYFYDGEQHPANGPLAEFLEIDSILDITSTRTYSDLLKSNGEGAEIVQGRQSFRTFTIPYVAGNTEMYAEIAAKLRDVTADYLSNPLHLTSQCSVDMQPFPSIIGKNSQERGGNAMGLSASDPHRIILELQCMWLDPTDDEEVRNTSREMTSWLQTKLPEWEAQAGVSNSYMPLFMNDAMGDQNVTGSYKDYAKLKALQQEVDPQGMLRTRFGGYKY